MNQLVNYIDLDWDRDRYDKKSILGYVFHPGFQPIERSCKKQNFVSLLTT
jgi:hypothetical protein